MSHDNNNIPTATKADIDRFPKVQHIVTRRFIKSSTRIMLVLKWLSVLTLAAFATANIADTDVPELIIDKTYVPAGCMMKTSRGDKIRVHYVGGVSLFVVRLTVTKLLLNR